MTSFFNHLSKIWNDPKQIFITKITEKIKLDHKTEIRLIIHKMNHRKILAQQLILVF